MVRPIDLVRGLGVSLFWLVRSRFSKHHRQLGFLCIMLSLHLP